LNIKYRDSIDETEILKELDNLFGLYSKKKNKGETFGDFVIREELVKTGEVV
jgi:sulfite reductase (NADPH) hemoprotein beta-component